MQVIFRGRKLYLECWQRSNLLLSGILLKGAKNFASVILNPSGLFSAHTFAWNINFYQLCVSGTKPEAPPTKVKAGNLHRSTFCNSFAHSSILHRRFKKGWWASGDGEGDNLHDTESEEDILLGRSNKSKAEGAQVEGESSTATTSVPVKKG